MPNTLENRFVDGLPASRIRKATTRIFLVKGSNQQGRPYSLEEARLNLDTGRIQANDLAWSVGMPEWVPLSRALEDAEKKHGRTPHAHEPVTAVELGAAGFQLAADFEDAYWDFIQELRQSESEPEEIDPARVWVELICLGVFVVNYGLFNSLKNGARDPVLSEYRFNLKRLQISGVSDSYKTVISRIYFYSLVLRKGTSSPEDLRRNIGKRFAMFCGAEKSKQLVQIGASVFDSIMGYVARWIEEIGTENIRS